MNSLSEDILRDCLLVFLDSDDQQQILKCSSRLYHSYQKVLRGIRLSGEKVIRCMNDVEYLRKVLSMMKDPRRQLSLFELDQVKMIPFRGINLCFSDNAHLFHQLLKDKVEIESLNTLLTKKNVKLAIAIFLEMCDLQLIQNLSLQATSNNPVNTSNSPLPYFPNIKKLMLSNLSLAPSSLPNLYSNHLQILSITSCNDVDVSELGLIPCVSIIRCQGVQGISHLTNNRILKIQETDSLESCPMLAPISCEEIHLSDSNVLLDLSNCQKLRVLELYHDYHWPLPPITNQSRDLPKTVKRCRLKDLSIVYFDWQVLTSQLTELVLSDDDTITSLVGLGLETIPVIELRFMERLESLTGLGRENKKVTVAYCDRITDFSPLQAIDIVVIEHCPGFEDAAQVSGIRELHIIDHPKVVRNLQSLEQKTEKLYFGKRYWNSSSFSFWPVSHIPYVFYEEGELDIIQFERFLEAGGRLEYQVFGFLTKNIKIKDLYDLFLSTQYQFYSDNSYKRDLYRITLIRK